MAFDQILFELVNGVVWGLILSVIALGLCLIYGLMGIINLAHGSLYMVGAMCAAYLINRAGLDFWLVLPLAALCVGLLTLALNTAIFERVLSRDPAIGLLATAGVFLTLDNMVLAIAGGDPQSVLPPVFEVVEFAGVYYPVYRLVAAGLALLVLVAVALFLRFTKYGLWMRAVPQARDLAAVTGVPIRRVNAVTAAIAGLTVGLAGALATPISGAHFQMGLSVIAACFIVVVIGGMGNLVGAVVVAVAFGLIRGLYSTLLSPTWSEVAALSTLLCVVYFKPNGIFGRR
ncbi:branched-chain amino acid ABC transporter permease [Xanthobacter dioxanivorans]|uniref:Branched-chain amino acid ABC transporter permease n=1 Tax=Xanthobacter dioxanivorans TaxID=2528964 RepID=A0A974PNV7_9HYPH|nr:branched-chain amino acid ABC transporter permease [Xanthobacter dioxanivorans]QRG07047.1 branched-chain amino acid ABC transporter permease [Xanthobacter dioxanivorans]